MFMILISISTVRSENVNAEMAVKIPDRVCVGAGVNTTVALAPQAVYDGGYARVGQDIKLRIANGGAGQSGLISAWGNVFIQYSVQDLGFEPFLVRSDQYLSCCGRAVTLF
jgi:hypothetical protein